MQADHLGADLEAPMMATAEDGTRHPMLFEGRTITHGDLRQALHEASVRKLEDAAREYLAALEHLRTCVLVVDGYERERRERPDTES